MIPDRAVLLTTVTVLAVVVLASGPLVPGVAFTAGTATADSGYRGFGEEAAGMGVEKRLAFGAATLPAGGELTPIGSDYRIELGPADLPVETGAQPIVLRYAVRIPELGVDDETAERVPAGTARTVRIEAPTGTATADRVAEGSYEATLVVSVEEGDWSGTIAEETVVLEVER
jgi:hypothetical protein